MQKREKKTAALFQIYLLWMSLIAFTVLLSEVSSADVLGSSGPPSAAPTTPSAPVIAPAAPIGAKAKSVVTINNPTGTATGASRSLSSAQALRFTGDKTATINLGGNTYNEVAVIKTQTDGGFQMLDAKGNLLGSGTKDQLATVQSQAATQGAALQPGYSYKVPLIGTEITNFATGHLVQGLVWSLAVVSVIQLVGGIAGFDKGLTNALTVSAVGGIMGGKLAYGLFGKGAGVTGNQGILTQSLSSTQAAFIGIGIAAAIFIATYKEEKKKLVRFQCLPWEPPIGGASCEECNKDPFRPCSEYRCRSLGQACQILNPGTIQERCAWVNPKDVASPTITPASSSLKPTQYSLRYVPDTAVRPPAIGSKIVSGNGANGCLPAFTPLEFGFITNEPAQCRIDYNHTTSFDAMQYYVGENNYFRYNHTQAMRLPAPSSAAEGALAPELKNDGTFALYTRCRDANGNENVDEYVFSFCVQQGPDTTPPLIESFSIPSGSPVTFNQQTVPIEVYLNEPAECKWSRDSKSYDDMENILACSSKSFQINSNLQYVCTGNLTGIQNREANTFYFRCKDQPSLAENQRNVNVQSTELILRGSEPVYIERVAPNGTIFASTQIAQTVLEVQTINGAQEGKALCAFSPTGVRDSFIPMFETDSYLHRQPLSLQAGNYTYFFRCVDAGGNAAQSNTTFTISVDQQPPRITRAYRQEGLKIVTDEDAECSYSLATCNFNFQEGIKMIYANPTQKRNHFAEWKSTATYHIKCRDQYGNQPPPNACSLVASAVQISQQRA